MINLYTCSFYHAKRAPGRISIARRAPKGMTDLPAFPELAPGGWFNSVSEARYRVLYAQEVLARLDPMDVVLRLVALAESVYGPGTAPVLLCWEKNPDTDPQDFCHRRLVASFLEEALGIDVPEIKTWPLVAQTLLAF